MTRSGEAHEREARLALLRRNLERLERGAQDLAQAGEVGGAAEIIEATRREMAALETITRDLRDAVEPERRRDALRGMTPAMAFCLAC